MGKGLRGPSPALVVSLIALFLALGGGVYAIGKAKKRTNGATIKVKSLPGNRLKLRSVPGNRLKPHTVTGASFAPGSISGTSLVPGSVGGKQIDESTLGPVPNAVHAESADSAVDAETALNAVNAVNATTVNGYSAGCLPKTQLFAGACWQTSASEIAATAIGAAAACAEQGGALPEALQLAAFAELPGVTLEGEEWSSDMTNLSGVNVIDVVTVDENSHFNAQLSSLTEVYRCVIPLVG